ncbi:unnamed protein product [Effrenium voratum]|nr:unnamed protein product [Effrenium voratum]
MDVAERDTGRFGSSHHDRSDRQRACGLDHLGQRYCRLLCCDDASDPDLSAHQGGQAHRTGDYHAAAVADLPEPASDLGAHRRHADTFVAGALWYLRETYGITQHWFEMLESVINVLFLADYIFQFYVSRNKLEFLYSLMAFVDVVTLMPVLIFRQLFGMDNDTSVVLRVVRVTKLFRILRSFRFLRNRPEDVTREVSMMFFGLFCLVFTASGFYQLIENDMRVVPNEPASVPFHEAFYFNAIEILGRPRIEPATTGGHLLLIVVVTAAFIIIPWQAASILKALQRDPYAMRTTYHRMSDSHIVIMGHIEFPVLNLLLYEAYHPDRGPVRPCDVVILSPAAPDHQILDLLGHPAYTGHVQYIQGSPQTEKDLARAKLHEAMAVLVLACKYPTDVEWQDTQVASIVLSCKAFKNAQLHRTRAFEGRRRLRVLAQVLTPETRDRIVCMPGWDKFHDLCLVIGELTAAMLAGSAMHRGLATMVLNLVSHTTSHDYDTKTERWFDLYHRGSRQEIYHCSVHRHSGICGQTIVEAAYHLYEHHGILLIAVKRTISDGSGTPSSTMSRQRRSRLLLFPGSEETYLQEGDRVFVIASSLPEAVIAVKRSRATSKPVLNRTRESTMSQVNGSSPKTNLVRKGHGDQHTWEEDSQPDFFTRLKENSNRWRDLQPLSCAATRLRKIWYKLCLGALDPADDDIGSFGPGDFAQAQPNLNLRGLEMIQSEAVFPSERPGLHSGGLAPRVDSYNSERSVSTVCPTIPQLPDEREPRLERLTEMLQEYCGDVAALQADLRQLGLRAELRLDEEAELREPRRMLTVPLCRRNLTMKPTDHLVELFDHVVVYGGDPTSIAFTVRMIQLRDPEAQAVVLNMTLPEKRQTWQGVNLEKVHFAKESLHLAEHQKDIRGTYFEHAKAVVILPLVDKDMSKAPLHGWELRRMVDSDTILTTNVIATRKWTAESFQDVWTVTQLFQEGSLNRFFGMNPEAQGATSLFEDRWMASAPLNMSPLFAAGHVIATTTVDRFLMDESFFNPDAMIIVERLFGLAGLTVGSKARGGLGSQSNAKHPCVFQIPAKVKMLQACRTFGEAANQLLADAEPVLPLGIFRYPKGNRSSYSMLVSLEAAQELDFRCPQFGACDDLGDLGMSNRLPFVVTNPPKDLVLLPTDLLFVLGRPRHFAEAPEPAAPHGPGKEMSPSDSREET